MSSKFETVATTLDALTDEKKPSCVEALTREFYAGLEKGLSNREAYYYAEVTHFLRDHDGVNNGPSLDDLGLDVQETDEAIKQYVVDTLMPANDDGKAEERVDVVIKWYDLIRSWGAPVALAFNIGSEVAQDEWEEANDLDEAFAIEQLNLLPTEGDKQAQAIKSDAITRFHVLRNEGNGVRASLRIVLQEAQDALEWANFLSSLAGRTVDRLN